MAEILIVFLSCRLNLLNTLPKSAQIAWNVNKNVNILTCVALWKLSIFAIEIAACPVSPTFNFTHQYNFKYEKKLFNL